MNKATIVRGELIGLKAKVKKSENKSLEGCKGKVIDETKNMLLIENGKIKKIPKKGTTFIFNVKTKKVVVEGDLLLGKPEQRLKRKVKRKRW